MTQMKREARKMPAVWPLPRLIVSMRDKAGRDNALAIGFGVNCSLGRRRKTPVSSSTIRSPASGRNLRSWARDPGGGGQVCDAGAENRGRLSRERPLLEACPVNIECSVVESVMPGSHEQFVGKVEAVHCGRAFMEEAGNIIWDKMDFGGCFARKGRKGIASGQPWPAGGGRRGPVGADFLAAFPGQPADAVTPGDGRPCPGR